MNATWLSWALVLVVILLFGSLLVVAAFYWGWNNARKTIAEMQAELRDLRRARDKAVYVRANSPVTATDPRELTWLANQSAPAQARMALTSTDEQVKNLGQTVQALQSQLQSNQSTIGTLSIQLSQARQQAELVAKLQSQVEESNSRAAEYEDSLARHQFAIADLKDRLREANERAAKAEALVSQTDKQQAQAVTTARLLAERQATIDALQARLDQVRQPTAPALPEQSHALALVAAPAVEPPSPPPIEVPPARPAEPEPAPVAAAEPAAEQDVPAVAEPVVALPPAPAAAPRRKAVPPQPDDFELIRGIGPTYERKLVDAGILTFDDLAGATVDRISGIIAPKVWQRIDFQEWIRQARELAEQKRRG